MFVIKLPPNPYYYGNAKPAINNKNSIDDASRKVSEEHLQVRPGSHVIGLVFHEDCQ